MTAPSPVFIVNTLSETVARKGSLLRPLAAQVNATLYADEIFGNLEAIAAKTKAAQQDWVFIEGGDGTCHGVITAFMRAYDDDTPLPRFTLIAGGMTNQVAGVIGIAKRKPAIILSLIAKGGTPNHYPLVNVQAADSPAYTGFLLSTGAVPMITEYTKQKLHKRGIGGSLAVLGGIWRGVSGRRSDVMRPTEAIIATGVQRFSGPHLGTVITTLPSVFKGLDPFWGDDDGPLRLTYAKAHCRRLLWHVLSLWRGHKQKDRRSDGLHSVNTDQIDFDYAGPVVLDGEFLSLLPNSFSVTPTRLVTFLRPKS